MKNKPKDDDECSHQETVQRRDEAVRRALNTPPKPLKEMKKGRGRKRQNEHPTASEKRG
jgi:hypothetical protein